MEFESHQFAKILKKKTTYFLKKSRKKYKKTFFLKTIILKFNCNWILFGDGGFKKIDAAQGQFLEAELVPLKLRSYRTYKLSAEWDLNFNQFCSFIGIWQMWQKKKAKPWDSAQNSTTVRYHDRNPHFADKSTSVGPPTLGRNAEAYQKLAST